MASPSSARGAMSPAELALRRLLGAAVGSDRRADEVIATTLALSGRPRLPPGANELLAFVKAHLLRELTREIGARLSMALLEDLVAELHLEGAAAIADSAFSPESISEPRAVTPYGTSAPPVSGLRTRRTVLVIDADRFGRASLARALVRGACDVRGCDDALDVGAALDASDALDAAIVDMAHPSLDHVLELLSARRPDLLVVARATSIGAATARLVSAGVARFDVRSKDEPLDDLVAALHRPRRMAR